MGGGSSEVVDNEDERAYTKWVLMRTLWPKRCHISGKPIPMMSIAYTNVRMKGKDPWYVEQWILQEEFIFARLKGDI